MAKIQIGSISVTASNDQAEKIIATLRGAPEGATVHGLGDMTQPNDFYFRIPAGVPVVIVKD